MEYNNNYGGHEAICQSLDAVMRTKIMEKRLMPATWSTILPAQCYNEGFAWTETSVPLHAVENVGTFINTTLKEEKNTPVIDFKLDHDRVELYTASSSIKVSEEEIEHYNLWTSRGGFAETSLVQRLTNSAISVYNSNHDQIFFEGDGVNTKGLFNSDACVDMTSAFSSYTTSLSFFIGAVGAIREATKGVVQVGTVLISPKLYGHLCNYYSSSDISNLNKILNTPIDTGPDGNIVTLQIKVIDRLSNTVTSQKPFGDVYFLSRDASQFEYYHKRLLIKPFRPIELRSFGAPIKFRYSDPVVYTKYALVKATVPANLDSAI